VKTDSGFTLSKRGKGGVFTARVSVTPRIHHRHIADVFDPSTVGVAQNDHVGLLLSR
jgi:hypothetical protein